MHPKQHPSWLAEAPCPRHLCVLLSSAGTAGSVAMPRSHPKEDSAAGTHSVQGPPSGTAAVSQGGARAFPTCREPGQANVLLGSQPPGGGLATPASLPQLPVSFKVPRPTGLPSHCPWSLSPSSFSPAAPPGRLSCLFRAAGPWQHGEGQPPHTPHFSLSKGGLSGFLLAVSRTQPTFPRGRACSVMCLSDHGQDFKGPHEILTPSLGDSPGYCVHLWVLAAVPPTELRCHLR